MRIVFVNPFGAGATYSGPAVFLNRLLEKVSQRHHTAVLFGARNQQDTALPGAAASVPIMTFQRYSLAEQLRWALRVTGWLLRHADEYDVVHIHGASLFNLLPAVAAIARRHEKPASAVLADRDQPLRKPIAAPPFRGSRELSKRALSALSALAEAH